MDWGTALSAFTTLFLVVDPIGLAPMFVALTSGMADAQRRQIAMRACLLAFCLLAVFGVFGQALLSGLGISLAAFRISGGLLLFLIAVDMLFERRTERREGRQSERPDPTVFPLAMPLIAGPGAMAAMILLAAGAGGEGRGLVIALAMLSAVLALVWLLFLSAGAIERALGRTGVMMVTRLLGMLLAALAVQFVLDGLRDTGVLAAG